MGDGRLSAVCVGDRAQQVQQRHDPATVLHHHEPPDFLDQTAGKLFQTCHARERDSHASVTPNLEEQ